LLIQRWAEFFLLTGIDCVEGDMGVEYIPLESTLEEVLDVGVARLKVTA
jgi:hypothetical protein